MTRTRPKVAIPSPGHAPQPPRTVVATLTTGTSNIALAATTPSVPPKSYAPA